MKVTNGLLFIILLLIVANLCGTLWLISKSSAPVPQQASSSSTIDKQSFLSEFARSIKIYNKGEQEAIWGMFSEYARSQMNKENAVRSILSLKDLFGKIQDGTYMYQEFTGKQGNLSFYKGYFTVNLVGSKIGEKGVLILTISSDGSANELVGFHLNSK